MQYIKTDNQPCKVTMKLRNSTSDQNVVISYVCLINDVKPTGSRHYVNKSHRIQYGVDEVRTYILHKRDELKAKVSML